MVLDLIVAVAVSLLVGWFLLLVLLVLGNPRGVDLAELRRFVPDVARLVGSLARDRSLARGARVRMFLLLAYLASPIDLVPDFIPVLGYADDAIVAAIALRSVVRLAGPDALDAHWTGTVNGLLVVRRFAGLRKDVSP